MELLDFGGRWVRALHTEVLERYPAWTRPYHLEMPLLTDDFAQLVDYEWHDDLVFCIPVAFPGANPQTIYRFEGYCKAALLLAYRLLTEWQLQDAGVRVVIGVSWNGREIFDGYARQCNFPDANILTLRSFANETSGWDLKFELLGASSLASVERRIHLDASSWLIPSSCPVATLIERWADTVAQPIVTKSLGVRRCWRGEEFPHPMRRTYDTWWERLAGEFGTTPDMERAYWFGEQDKIEFIWGGVFGLSKSFWQNARYVELLHRCRDVARGFDDEVILSLFARELPLDEAQVGYIGDLTYQLEHCPSFPSPHMDDNQFMVDWRNRLGYEVTS